MAYALLLITDLDPLHYNLLFERFLNPERVSMPDFDIDFCQSNRDRVIDYVKDRYGKDGGEPDRHLRHHGRASAAIRDVGRVLDLSYGFRCDGISKLIPNAAGHERDAGQATRPTSILKEGDKNNYAIGTMEPDPERIASRPRKKTWQDPDRAGAARVEGMTRNIGMHAGGVLIAPGKLTDFCPLYHAAGQRPRR